MTYVDWFNRRPLHGEMTDDANCTNQADRSRPTVRTKRPRRPSPNSTRSDPGRFTPQRLPPTAELGRYGSSQRCKVAVRDDRYTRQRVSDHNSSNGGPSDYAETRLDLLSAMRRRSKIIVLCALVGSLLGGIYASIQDTSFVAKSTMLLVAGPTEQSPGGGTGRTLDVETWATVARSTGIITELADAVDATVEGVRAASSSTAEPTGDIMVLEFRSEDRQTAIDGARAYAEVFLAERSSTINADRIRRVNELSTLADQIGVEIDEISDAVDEEEARGEAASPSRLSILTAGVDRRSQRLLSINDELATIDTQIESGRLLVDPSSAVHRPGVSRGLAILSGLLVGALVGVGAALVIDRYDDRYCTLASPASIGVRELARVRYSTKGRFEPTVLNDYARVVTRLAFERYRSDDEAPLILLQPIESSTLPIDAADSVTSALEIAGPASSLAVGVVRVYDVGVTDHFWESLGPRITSVRQGSDIVLLPVESLDRSAFGLGLARFVDHTVLVVSPDTSAADIKRAVDDLNAIGPGAVDVLVLIANRSSKASG